jgi:uncharacterized membrane protein
MTITRADSAPPSTPMSENTDRSFASDFKRFFSRGLAVLLPSVLTLWIIVYAYRFIDSTIAEPINGGLRQGLAHVSDYITPLRDSFDPPQDVLDRAVAAQPLDRPALSADQLRFRLRQENIEAWWARQWFMNLIGLFVAIVAVYIAGRLLGGFFGRGIWRGIERLITSVPIFKQIYPSVKQVVDFLFSEEKPIKFNRVVMVQYPSPGLWALGLVTGQAMKTVTERTGSTITVFVPCSPAPFSGFTINVNAAELIEVPISIDEAIRYLVSGGVLVPGHQAMPVTPPRPIAAAMEGAARMRTAVGSLNAEGNGIPAAAARPPTGAVPTAKAGNSPVSGGTTEG